MVIQRFETATNLKIQFLCGAPHGAYRIGADGRPRFTAAAAPTPTLMQIPPAAMIARLIRLFVSHGTRVAEPDGARVEETTKRAERRQTCHRRCPCFCATVKGASRADRDDHQRAGHRPVNAAEPF